MKDGFQKQQKAAPAEISSASKALLMAGVMFTFAPVGIFVGMYNMPDRDVLAANVEEACGNTLQLNLGENFSEQAVARCRDDRLQSIHDSNMVTAKKAGILMAIGVLLLGRGITSFCRDLRGPRFLTGVTVRG